MKLSIKKQLILSLLVFIPVLVVANPIIDGMAKKYLSNQEKIDQLCVGKFENLPMTSCRSLIEAGVRSITGDDVDEDALKATLKSDLKTPEFLNSVLNKVYSEEIPIGLEFKSLDTDGGENVLGLSYTIEKDFLKVDQSPSNNWNRIVVADFNASGTITNESDKNPRNFLDTKVSTAYAWSTRIPVQSDGFGQALTNTWHEAGQICDKEGADSDECKTAKSKGVELLDSTSDFLNSFQRYYAGIDIGYESDQSFDVSQTKFGAFVFGQYEAWGNSSFLGRLGLTPAFRLALDKIDPNDETPRAMAGDGSSYYRYTGEVSLWMPVGTHFGRNLAFTLNYRHWGEIAPSDTVEVAGLDSYNLRTISLSSPTGLFISYSSGKLPFDVNTADVVELGWKTYF